MDAHHAEDKMFEDITKKLDNFEKWQRIAALTVFAKHKPRIFERGLAADGSKIGNYEDGAYKKKRAQKGRETGYVNLEMFGSMKKDYQVTKAGIVGFGFSNKTEFDKATWNEDRYGKDIFQLTEEEGRLYTQTLDELIFENRNQ